MHRTHFVNRLPSLDRPFSLLLVDIFAAFKVKHSILEILIFFERLSQQVLQLRNGGLLRSFSGGDLIVRTAHGGHTRV